MCSGNAFFLYSFISDRISHPVISGFTGQIFTKFSPYSRYLFVDYWSDLFLIAQGTLPWQPMLGSKYAKSAYLPSFVAPAFKNSLEYRNSDFKNSQQLFLYIVCKFGDIRSSHQEFKRGKVVHLLDTAAISTEFFWEGAISTQFCLTSSLGGVIAMPHGLLHCATSLICWSGKFSTAIVHKSLYSTPPLAVKPSELNNDPQWWKTRMMGLARGKWISTKRLAVLTQSTRVTHRHIQKCRSVYPR